MPSTPAKAFKLSPDRHPRLYPRYRCEFPVTINTFSDKGHHQLSAHGRDLSEGGVGVVAAAEIPLGEVCSLTFSLPGSSEIWQVCAVLRYRRGFHHGFEFLTISDSQSNLLAKYLPELARADSVLP